MSETAIIVTPAGVVECLYTECVDLSELGSLSIRRATDIVFDHASQEWWVLGGNGTFLFSHGSREACLAWERDYLDQQETAKHGGLK